MSEQRACKVDNKRRGEQNYIAEHDQREHTRKNYK